MFSEYNRDDWSPIIKNGDSEYDEEDRKRDWALIQYNNIIAK